MKKIKFIYIYLLFLIFFILGYFMNFSIKNISITTVVDKYLGIMAVPILIFLFIYFFIFFTKNKLKREVREIKLYFCLLLMLLITFIFILFKTGVNFIDYNKILIDDNFLKKFIALSLYKYKIGYFFTYLFYLLLKIKFKVLLFTVLFSIFILFFLIVYAPLKNYIKKIILKHKEKKESLRKERLLYEQIKIKEELDKKIMLKEKKFIENKEKRIEERIEAFRKNIKLEKTITLGDEQE